MFHNPVDDPMSAMDAHVGAHIFDECIKKALHGKTRILVTHHLHLLDQCDLVVILEEGKVKAAGAPKELSSLGMDLEAYTSGLSTTSSSSSSSAAEIIEGDQRGSKISQKRQDDADNRKKDRRSSEITIQEG